MRHPSTRAERRFVRALARERYRSRLRLGLVFYPERIEDHPNWMMGGKQCEAHGNRCGHSLSDRHEIRRELKTLRKPIQVSWL